MAYTTQYIGSRYVPLFAEPAEWNSARTYEPLTIVMHEGNSYTSKQYVPIGIEITNEKFWALTGNYNAQVEAYRRETAAVQEDIDTLLPKADFSAENTVKNYVDRKTAAVQEDIDTLLPKADFSAENTVKNYVDRNKTRVLSFDTVADMQNANYLEPNMTCHTNGFHASGDGGAAYYTVSASGTANGMDVLALQSGLFAVLIATETYVTPEQFGAYVDGTHDDTNVLAYMLDSLDSGALICLRSDKTLTLSEQIVLDKNISLKFDGNVKLLSTGGFVLGTSAFRYEYNRIQMSTITGSGHDGNTNAFKMVNAMFNDIKVGRITSCRNGFVFNEDKLSGVVLGQNIITYTLIDRCNRGVYFVGADDENVWDNSTVVWAEGNQLQGGFINRCYYAGIEFEPNIKCGDTLIIGSIDCIDNAGAYDILDNTSFYNSQNVQVYAQPNMYISNFFRNKACVFPPNVMYLNSQTGIKVAGEIASAFAMAVRDINDDDNSSFIGAGQMEISNSNTAFIDMKNDSTTDRTMRLSVNNGKSTLSTIEDLNLSAGAAHLVRMQRVLRGYSIPKGSTQLQYTFSSAVPDANYSVFVTPNWPTTISVSSRLTTGCIISFGTPAPASAEIEIMFVGVPS